jgi:hypothetical protein
MAIYRNIKKNKRIFIYNFVYFNKGITSNIFVNV